MRFATTAIVLTLLATAGVHAQDLVITEIMYNSQESGDEDVEYIEILNATGAAIDLTDYYVIDDDDEHGVVPLEGSVAPCGVVIVANNNAAFVLKYGAGWPLNPNDMNSGPWGLGNGGDIARVFRQLGGVPDPATDALVDVVEFDDTAPWPTEADGDGPALELIDPSLDNNDASSWAITVVDGTPGIYLNCNPVSVDDASWGGTKARYR
jgi:hypothetical protein